MDDLYGNPSSSHISGLRARNILESACKLARDVPGATTGEVVFTSGATEAIQMAIFSALCAAYHARQQDLVLSKPHLLMCGGNRTQGCSAGDSLLEQVVPE